MKNVVQKIHRWLGFPLGIVFLITFGTGLLTAIDEGFSRLSYRLSNPAATFQAMSLEQHAEVLEVLNARHEGVRQILLPNATTPFYQVTLNERRVGYAIDNLDDIAFEQPNSHAFFDWVLKLHRNFLLGKEGLFGIEGAHYAAWVSLLALGISLIGAWLWWPMRRSFRARQLVPTRSERKAFYFSHMSGGIVVLVFILLMALTGASITFRSVTQNLLGVERDSPDQKQPAFESLPLDNSWSAWLSAAQAQIPHGELRRIQFPRQRPAKPQGALPLGDLPQNENGKPTGVAPSERANETITLVYAHHEDWFGIPNNKVQIDTKQSALTGRQQFAEYALGEKIAAVLKPLHTGKELPAAYVLLQILFSLVGVVMVFSGVLSFAMKKRRIAPLVATNAARGLIP